MVKKTQNTQTNILTFQLIESIGPEGRCFENALVLANGLSEKCQGTITRERATEGGNIERSTIDLVLVS